MRINFQSESNTTLSNVTYPTEAITSNYIPQSDSDQEIELWVKDEDHFRWLNFNTFL
jgi:hypothetical protein